jgi:cephalosporin-C deacetylase-like acetyl esterase
MQLRGLPLAVMLVCAGSGLAENASITIPPVSGALTIDGKPGEPAWQGARLLPLVSSEFGAPFPAGGEARVATRGAYLCLSARVPEPDRVVAHSTGLNPNWWPEDLIIWNIRLADTAARRVVNLSLSVNPLGAYSFKGTGLDEPGRLLVAASVGPGEWTVEAAIPLARFGHIGFLGVERVRPARPDAPELRWFWPARNELATFQFAEFSRDPAPEFRPAPLRSTGPSPGRPAPALDWIPRNAWTAGQRDQLHLSRMVENSLRSRMSAVADEEKREWQKVDSRQAWERFRDERLGKLRKWMGDWPERTPLHAAVTRRMDSGEGFVIENLVYESRPHLLVTANLYLPENPSGKIPAVVVVHSHHAPKTQAELQDLGMTWARSGAAVLIMDQICAGERSQSQPWPRESYYGRYALGNQLLLAGESLMKWMVWDLMRGIDVLLGRPYVDPQRIVLLGAVAGGGDPAALTAVLDPRVAAVIPFNFGEAGPEEHYIEGPRAYPFDTAWPGWGEWETTRCLPRSSIDQFFPWLLCASVAPRPFLYSFEIGWPEGVEREPAWARYKKVFEFYGARGHLDEVHGFGPFPGPGECTNVGPLLRRRIYPILARWLNVPAPAAEYHDPLPDSKLSCLTPAAAAERRAGSASAIALELARVRLGRARAQAPSADQLRKALREKLGDIEPLEKPAARLLWEKPGSDLTVEALAIQTAPGITLPVLLLKPVRGAGARAPAVLAVAEGGKAGFLENRGEELLALVRDGVTVCLPDVRGTGELAASALRGPGAMGLAATELMLGETMLGGRLKDFRTVFRYLASRPDIDPARIAFWGDSFAGTNPNDFAFDQSEMQAPGPFVQHQAEPMGALVALLAGLYEERAAAIGARRGLVSFVSVLEDRFCHVPLDAIVPGILEAADVADIVTALGTRPVLLEGLVDGRNRVAPNAKLASEYARALKRSPRLIVRDRPGDPRLPAWLASGAANPRGAE